jgi:hypothetical protein
MESIFKPGSTISVPALHLAVKGGRIGTAQLLLKHIARIESSNDDLETAVHQTAHFEHKELLSFLLRRDAFVGSA